MELKERLRIARLMEKLNKSGELAEKMGVSGEDVFFSTLPSGDKDKKKPSEKK